MCSVVSAANVVSCRDVSVSYRKTVVCRYVLDSDVSFDVRDVFTEVLSWLSIFWSPATICSVYLFCVSFLRDSMFSRCEDRCMVVCDAVRSGISIRRHIPRSSNLHCVCSLFNDAVGSWSSVVVKVLRY
jgi:hypothetical protein